MSEPLSFAKDDAPGSGKSITRRRAVRIFAPLLAYLALAFIFYGRHADWQRYYFGFSNDSLLFIWYLNWWPFALTHGLNPFICNYVWFPAGYNLAWATAIPCLALLMWPVTALGGPVLSYNILAVTAPALSAWTGYFLLHNVTKNRAASLVGGFLFGFCTPELYQLGQLNLSAIYLVPLAVLLCLRRLQGTLRRRGFIALFGLLLAVQLGISMEILACMGLMGLLSWAVFLLFGPAATRFPLLRLAVDVALAAPLTLGLTAPYLYYLVQGLPEIPAQIHPLWIQMVEALRLAVPLVPVHSLGQALAAIAAQWRGYTPDYNSYVGAPALLILLLYFSRNLGRPYLRALLILIVLMTLLGLGPVLMLNGRLTSIALPWMLFTHLPLINAIIPLRLLVFPMLAIAMAIALWLAQAQSYAARLPRFALAGLACLFLAPAEVKILPEPWQTHPLMQTQTELRWSRWPDQPFFTPAHVKAALGTLPNVLLLPDPLSGPGMAWQLTAGMGFTQAGGYTGIIPVSAQAWNDLTGFLAGGPPVRDFAAAMAAYCAAHRVDYILIGPGTPPDAVSAIAALGWPHDMDQGIDVVKTPGWGKEGQGSALDPLGPEAPDPR